MPRVIEIGIRDKFFSWVERQKKGNRLTDLFITVISWVVYLEISRFISRRIEEFKKASKPYLKISKNSRKSLEDVELVEKVIKESEETLNRIDKFVEYSRKLKSELILKVQKSLAEMGQRAYLDVLRKNIKRVSKFYIDFLKEYDMEYSMKISVAIDVLIKLHSLLESHTASTRYPDYKLKPSDYTYNKPLVKNIPKIADLLFNVIDILMLK